MSANSGSCATEADAAAVAASVIGLVEASQRKAREAAASQDMVELLRRREPWQSARLLAAPR
jgi:hypothetical protein